MTVVVEIAGVTVRRGTALLLDHVDLKVEEGERWVIIGPNGAGKTTLLRVLATQLHPTDGIVEILGETLGSVDVFELRPRIGLASSALAEQVPYEEKVADLVVSASYGIVGRWRELYEDQDFGRAEDLMSLLQVDNMAERRFGTLSEGERKRVQIARALMTDPELLLLDEPGAGLDLAGREALLETLTALAEDPAAPTSIMVTHHVEEIPVGITHLLLLRAGKVVASGPLQETLTSENLSRTFGMRLQVQEQNDRWMARSLPRARRMEI